LVYHVAIKVLGILLFAIEIGWFVARPFLNEAKAWWSMRGRFRLNPRVVLTLTGAAAIIGLLLLPVTSSVSVPVVWRASSFATLYAPFASRLETVLVKPGQSVVAGQPLFVLAAPDLDGKLRKAELRITLLRGQIARRSSSGEQLDRIRGLEADLSAVLAERRGLLDSRERLVVRAPLAGTVRDMEDALRPGRWLGPTLPLAMIVGPGNGELVGYVGEGDFDRLKPGAEARFHPDDPLAARRQARVRAVDPISVPVLDVPALASTNGGPVAVEGPMGADPDHGSKKGHVAVRNALTPVEAVYRITLDVDDAAAPVGDGPSHVTRGIVRIAGEARSVAGRFWRVAASVVIREMGF